MKILQGGLPIVLTLAVVLGLLQLSSAQSSRKKTSSGPRAVAVVEWGAKGPHLIPVSIMIDGKFYDAGIYLADPVPMALDPGNVYEVQKAGDPAGLFTIDSVMQTQGTNSFFGVGKFMSQADVEAAAKRAAAAKARAAARTPSHQSSEDSGPPRLRRAHGAPIPQPGPSPQPGPNPPGTPPGTPPLGGPPIPQTSPVPPNSGPNSPGGDSGGDRPTMKRPKQTPPPSSTPDDTGDDSDTDRPTLKREDKPAPQSTAPAATASTPSTSDNERPVLKRGTEGQQAETLKGPASPAAPPPPPKGMNRTEVAVSDATTTPPHPFKFVTQPDTEQHNQDGTRQLALQVVRDYAAKRPGAHPGSLMEDMQVHQFDLDYSNEAVIVLTATVPEAAPTPSRVAHRKAGPTKTAKQEPEPSTSGAKNTFYVTVVARENYDGTVRKVFSSVTDSNHLDVYPRLELIDAVDADGSGRGELLFRQISDGGTSYSIYRVGVETMTALYNSGAPLQQ